MVDRITEKSKYKSPTTGEYCTAAQYIAELLTIREAKKNGIDVRYKFWNHKPWSNKYRYNVTEAYKLLKKYSPKAIIKGIDLISWAYSLKTKKLLEAIKIEDEKLLQADKMLEKIPVLEVNTVTESVPKHRGKKKNTISLLKQMENDERISKESS